jgi:hypothetical protein
MRRDYSLPHQVLAPSSQVLAIVVFMSADKLYRAFLLRLWCATNAQWRASLEDPHTGQRRAFATLDKLVEYLVRVTQPASAGGEPGPPACEPGQGGQPGEDGDRNAVG